MEHQFRQIAALLGDPTRATILWTLLNGRAFTATELAIAADTSPSNISMHLNKLLGAGLLSVESQGRHKYYTFSRKEIAYAIESMVNLIDPAKVKTDLSQENGPAIRYCRTCYDHLAGKVGVLITESLLKQRLLLNRKNNLVLSTKGEQWFSRLGMDTHLLKEQRRSFIRPCLDWSERRPHIAGSLGAALLEKMFFSDWMRRTKSSRVIIITGTGQKKLNELFQISV